MLLRAACMAALALLAAAKLYETTKIPALYDSYARDEASWSTALDRWRAGVRGWPLRGMWFMWTAGVLVFMHGRNPTGRRTKPGGLIAALALLCAATGAACWVYWAGDGQLWWKALDYRRWILPLTAPFFILATIEACLLALARRRNVAAASAPEPALQFAGGHTVDYGRAIGRSPASVRHGSTEQDGSELANVLRDLAPLRPTRDAVGLLLAATFAIVLGLQSTVWHRLGGRLMADVRRYPGAIVPESAIPYLANGPLDHWATADYVMAMQGKSPRQLLMDPRSEEHIYDRPPKIPHWDFYPHPPDPAPGAMGWFDLRPLLKQLPAQPPRTHGGPVRLDIKSTPD